MALWIRIQMNEQKKLIARDQSINAEREKKKDTETSWGTGSVTLFSSSSLRPSEVCLDLS